MKLLLLSLLLVPALAAAQPDLSKQETWRDKEKKEFLQYLRSGQGGAAAAGSAEASVKSVRGASKEGGGMSMPRKPRYVSLSLLTDSVLPLTGGNTVRREGLGLGAKVLAGGHVFTWLRYYAGVQGTRFRQEKLDGSRPVVTHLQTPAGLEVALVPLGTAQTQYLLLRGGAALHYFSAKGHAAADFRTPLLGWQATVNAGLGYEWQIPDTRWRINTLVEGYRYLVRQGSTARFYGLGFTLGTVYTF